MIMVDAREPKKIIKKGYEFFPDLTVAMLPVGDVVKDNICIERKSSLDFASSVNGRMFNQAIQMRANFEHPVIVITGTYEDVAANRYQQMPYKRYQGAIDDLKLLYNIPVLEVAKSENEEIFWKTCERIFRKMGGTPPTEIKRVKKYNGDNRISVLCGIPNLGPKKARMLLKQFKTIEEICSSSVEDLMSVKGIGKKQANMIHKTLRE